MRTLHISPEGIEELTILGGRGIWLKKILPLQEEVKLLTCTDVDKTVNGVDLVTADFMDISPTPIEIVGQFAWQNFKLLKAGVKLCNEWLPDIIHVHDADAVDVAVALKEIFDIPIIYTIHLSAVECFMQNFDRGRYNLYLRQREMQIAMHEADAIHVCSNAYRDGIFSQPPTVETIGDMRYYSQLPVEVIYNGVDPTDFDDAGNEVSPKYMNVFFAGRFAKGKGLETLCETLDILPNIKLWLAGQFNGTKEQEEEYETTKVINAYKEKYPNRMEFLGHMVHRKIGYWAKQMDVWVAPSWHCPFELVGLEAMACETLLVATKTGAFLEYCVDGVNATLVTPKDAQSLADGIEIAAHNKTVGDGRITANEYTWEKTNDKIQTLYSRALGRKYATVGI